MYDMFSVYIDYWHSKLINTLRARQRAEYSGSFDMVLEDINIQLYQRY